MGCSAKPRARKTYREELTPALTSVGPYAYVCGYVLGLPVLYLIPTLTHDDDDDDDDAHPTDQPIAQPYYIS